MEAVEQKKKMPMITTYSSDNEIDLDNSPEVKPEKVETPKNYAEWKRTQKTKNGAKANGKIPRVRSDGSLEPLGDISTSEDESYCIDENLNILNVYNHIKENRAKLKNGLRNKRKKTQASKFLLFCRQKQDYYDSLNENWSFSEVCRMCRVHWDRMTESEKEDFEENIEQKILEYQDHLYQIKSSLSNTTTKPQQQPILPLISKEEVSKKVEANSSPSPASTPQESIENSIPARLQNLAGKASVYHAQPSHNNKKSHLAKGRHSIFAYTRNIIEDSNSILEYVDPTLRSDTNKASMNSNIDLDSFSSSNESSEKSDNDSSPEKCVCCGIRECVYDARWQGANYCGVECLMEHCRREFQLWIKQKRKECNGNDNTDEDDVGSNSSDAADEVVNYLTSLASKENYVKDTEMPNTHEKSNSHLQIDQNTTPPKCQSESDIYSPPIIQTTLSLNSH